MLMTPEQQRARAAQLRERDPDSRAATLYELVARIWAERGRLVADYAVRLEDAPES
jgi:hypothetical protein